MWGNQTDLSLLQETKDKRIDFAAMQKQTVEQLDNYKHHIICDESEKAWSYIQDNITLKRIDFILDNSGPEIFSDLCFADWLIEKKVAKEVRLHVKTYPWFVSDATRSDLDWTIEQCIAFEADTNLNNIGKRWRVSSFPFYFFS